MRQDLKSSFFRRLNIKEAWVIFFILGIIMMNYPFIIIFNKPRLLFNLPVFYLYLYLGWLISICVIYLFVKSIAHEDNKGERL
jgi:hypothetical protein